MFENLELMKHISWIFSGIGNIVVDKVLNSPKNELQISPQQNLIVETVEIKEEAYSVSLGERHKFLREQYLKLNPRKMADFYGYTEVAELEKYEKGDKDFPKESLEKLKETFFVNESFLEEGNSRIFRQFHLNSDEVKNLLEDGFIPHFLCCTHDRSHLDTFPVFHKQENKYFRVIVANNIGSFSSGHGGLINIEIIIKEMLHQEMTYTDAFIQKVDRSTWQKLNQGVFYSNNIHFGDGLDEECADIFYKHYRKIKAYLASA